MHSSISSSEETGDRRSWGFAWIAGLVTVLLILGGMEAFWRSRGHEPSVTDDVDLWSVWRAEAAAHGTKSLALLGASRIQLDLSAETLRSLLPGFRPAMLAVDGRHPLAVLADLAEDDRFTGIVLCDITAMGFQREYRAGQQEYVDYYHRHSTAEQRLNRRVSSWFQDRLVFLDPYLKARRLLYQWRRSGTLPGLRYLVTSADRFRKADYGKTDVSAQRNHRLKRIREIYGNDPVPSPGEWAEMVRELEPAVRRIGERGGKVVFVRLPTTGEHWRIDEETWPRALYWDRIHGLTGAETIHFRDLPGLEDLACPEGSHLDYRDSPRFTGILVGELLKRKIVEK